MLAPRRLSALERLDQLTRPEPRLPRLSHWLLNEVWTEAAFEAAGRSPWACPLHGERCGRAALPSDTEAFVGRRFGSGLPEIGPFKLTSRAELRERNIRRFYFGNPGDHHTIDESDGALLLWSRFPDQRYTDSTAVDETLYDALRDGPELAWQRTVQAVAPDRRVLVTSDRGYILLGAG